MPSQDTSKIKGDIINFLRIKGPSLPIHISQEIRFSALFTSAFLSELFSEKKIKMSHLRVGSSPVYFLSGQEEGLEKFSNHLKSKEKEAFSLIKNRKILVDQEQEPAIRIALRAIKDFAIPFEENNELCWRYFIIGEPEKETSPRLGQSKEEIIEETISSNINQSKETKEETSSRLGQSKEKIEILEEIKKETPKKAQKKKAPKKIIKSKKGNDKFLARVKDFLSKENIEIIGIESFSKEALVLKVKTTEGERAFVAYNKKKIEEKDLISANKKAEELGLSYLVLSLEEPSKKIKELIEAIKNLSGIEKIE